MWLTTLDAIECATIGSSIGTLAIAISSIYQMHVNQRDSFFPILSVDDATFHSDGLTLQVRNYGTGPALNIKIEIRGVEIEAPLQVFCHGHAQTALHVATNERKEIDLVGSMVHLEHGELHLRYECIRHRNFEDHLALAPFLEPKAQFRRDSRSSEH